MRNAWRKLVTRWRIAQHRHHEDRDFSQDRAAADGVARQEDGVTDFAGPVGSSWIGKARDTGRKERIAGPPPDEMKRRPPS